MDTELQALEQFRNAAPVMPVLLRWAMAGAVCVGWTLGLVVGLVLGAAIGRRLRW